MPPRIKRCRTGETVPHNQVEFRATLDYRQDGAKLEGNHNVIVRSRGNRIIGPWFYVEYAWTHADHFQLIVGNVRTIRATNVIV